MNEQVIEIYNKYKHISKKGAQQLFDLVKEGKKNIRIENIKSKWKKFYLYNMSKFDKGKHLKDVYVEEI